MRANNERRVPIPSQRIFAPANLRLNTHPFAGTSVEARKRTVLQFSINCVRVFGIYLAAETVTAIGDKPVGIRYTGSAARARRPTKAEIVLSSSVDIVKRRCVVGGDIIELGYWQIAFELPIHAPVVTLVDATVAAHQIVVGVIRIDPDIVIVDVL